MIIPGKNSAILLIAGSALALTITARFAAGDNVTRPAAQEAAPPAAETILDRYVEVTGGKRAYGQLHNTLSQGSFYVVGTGIRGSFKAYEAEPNKTLSIIEIDGGERVEEGTLGDVAWDRSSKEGPHVKEGEDRSIALREATFNSRLHWRKLYRTVQCEGSETLGERKCYRVLLTPNDGQPLTHFYDVESGLLTKSVIMVSRPSGPIPTENLYSDYREYSGVLFPCKLAHRVGNEETVVILDSIRPNVDIAWYRFDLPAEVKALLAKSRK